MVRPTRGAGKDTSVATPSKKAVNGSQGGRKRKSGGGKKSTGRPVKSSTPKSAKRAKKEEKSYEVEEVRGIQSTKTGDTKVLIKWANYPEKENSWEPIASASCSELVRKFLNNALANVQDDKEVEEGEEEAA